MAATDMTTSQLAFLTGLLYATIAWVYAEWLEWKGDGKREVKADEESLPLHTTKSHGGEHDSLVSKDVVPASAVEMGATGHLYRFATLDGAYLLEHRLTLRAIVEFGGLLVYMMLCDRTSLFPEAQRSYSRDLFMFIYLLLCLAAAFTSLKKHAGSSPSVDYLNRHQTEEWKGWMQILFLLYHYFVAKEMYNAIRVFIAAYVWMTGFGNFSYYYVRKDFSIGRFCQMMWRLNFLVFFCCVTLNNDYMLYYICPMHTLFTLMVFGICAIGAKYNENNLVIYLKFAVAVAVVIGVWEIPGMFDLLWSPFTFLVAYNDPRRPSDDIMHEWRFRSGLDRYIWIIGMMYAFGHPVVERWLERLEDLKSTTRQTVRAGLTISALAVGYYWYVAFYSLGKLEYNKVHPYTSWIPITVYIVLRNLHPTLRHWSMTLFAWCGKITLETYICQFHIWLRTSIPNGQPVAILSLLPEEYPLLNFLFVSAIYIFVSNRLFHLVNTLKTAFVPAKNNAVLAQTGIGMLISGIVLYGLTFVFIKLPLSL
ncbi:cas1 domain-containing protein [Klebsormidium nitens]|uniref:Cas1 domain-containing protein n=1 Tax=Klebsormidium nitens TaxID=105231 RepID=A0A1Y1I2S6_KLENI|nr:cas1 domain-containing protein [Klebsormidium nitens]|eukprot:GAQ84773.1 cas1 domain-containing protein [Klebsormidium nitens]